MTCSLPVGPALSSAVMDCLHSSWKGALPALVLANGVMLTSGYALGADRPVELAPPTQIFDELRFGASASIESGHNREDGVFPDVQVLFNPFGYNPADNWEAQLLHPQLHVGTSIGTSDTAARQLYGGLTWTITYANGFFTEAGFGGVVHDGNLNSENDGPKLGCRLLFHEYVGAGYSLDNHWSVMGQLAHSSHADLCDGPNAGMTRAGLLVGYKF